VLHPVNQDLEHMFRKRRGHRTRTLRHLRRCVGIRCLKYEI
jgi:hypothetical protein